MKGNDIIFLIILVFVFILLFAVPENIFFSDNNVCIHYKIFGIECPFCGLTRAAHSLLRFNFTSAAAYNLAAFPLGMLVLNEIVRRITHHAYLLKVTYTLMILTAATFLFLYGLRIHQGITS